MLVVLCLAATAQLTHGAGSAPLNLNVSLISYLSGGSSSSINTALSTAVDSQGRVYVAGSGPFNFGAHAQGSGDGYVLRLKNTESSVDGVWRFSSEVTGIRVRDVAGTPRILIQGDFGITVLDQNFKQVWNVAHGCSGTKCKSDIATDGTVSMLLTSGHLFHYDASGKLLGDKQLGKNHYTDTAIDPYRKMVIYSYFFQSYPHHIPVQVPCLLAMDYLLSKVIWTDYCVGGIEDYDTQNMADSRIQHIYYNDNDKKLYFAGYTDGGNSIFRYDTEDIQNNHGSLHGLTIMPSHQRPTYDKYVNTYNMHGATSISVGGRIDTDRGQVEEVQFYIARLSSGAGNSVKSIEIAAGVNSVMFMAQSSVASIDNRNDLKINNMTVGGYGGSDAVLLAVPSNFSERLAWHTFAKTSGHANAVTVSVNGYNGKNRVAFIASSQEVDFFEVKPISGTKRASAKDTQYVLVILDM
ncbi:uncharacterized protein LOC124267207 [Haliotis rubra]|uniref:uncharacterized protein LOC124267207 n=1 Tax=Haliotis rubra TaxID=36100 RepID=UPI001EE5C478|nr:uncharacterized protein LOC124267207 [Haliotis rubra]